jgi:hypothetical protein
MQGLSRRISSRGHACASYRQLEAREYRTARLLWPSGSPSELASALLVDVGLATRRVDEATVAPGQDEKEIAELES